MTINTVQEYFDKNRYAYITGVLTKEKCNEITQYMWNLKEKGMLNKDEQCPLSWSVYGNPVLDKILFDLAEPLGKQLGVNILPTYTYARLYQPGEVLKRHIDRESCEISATLTLGHDEESEIWPIFFSKDPEDVIGKTVTIDIGDMVVYRGNELTHWRPAYKGRWQTQVFFHFVDADGPNKEWAFDKRNIKNQEIQPNQNIKIKANYSTILIDDGDDTYPDATAFHENFKPELAFTREECDRIISIAKSKYPTKATVGTKDSGTYNSQVRRVDNYDIPCKEDTKWIFEKLIKAVGTANQEYFKFELVGITHSLQLLHYKSDEKGFYDWHVDVGSGPASKRKLSVVCMLSDPSEYEGGSLIINNGVNQPCINTKGSINIFPSYMLHTVTPVLKGERWVLVIWVHGSKRFS